MSDFDVEADTKQRNPDGTRVCLTCGEPFSGELERDEYIPFYSYCSECDRKRYFGTRAQYERQ